MMNLRHALLLFIFSGLVACADNTEQAEIKASSQAKTDSASGEELAALLRQAKRPENSPKIGTAIENMLKPTKPEPDTKVVSELKNSVMEIMWNDLTPEDYSPDSIMEKFQVEMNNVEEGSLEERELLKVMMAEFNNAPPNEKLNGKKVRIPGFVSPLDQSNGMVGEFLLVPSFGSCIHSPPPPVNQTILVKPTEGKSIALDKIYEPVWVTGTIKVETTTTSLAQAGYLIEGAQLEKYTGNADQ